MSDDPPLKMYETQAELDKLKKEMKEIQKLASTNEEKFSEMTMNNDARLKTISSYFEVVQRDVTTLSENFNTLSENVTSLSARVTNNDQILLEIRDTLRQQNEALRIMNETLEKQNENIRATKIETETILLLGGHNGRNEFDSLLIFENNRQYWKELNIKLPYATCFHGAQFLNNNLYIFGGNSNHTYKLSKSLQWEKMANMNQKRSRISNSSVILNNQILVCGGNDAPYVSLKSVEMYDPLTNKWKYMKEMNQCRSDAAAAVVNGKIFCCGGWNGKELFNSVECYDPFSDVWTEICNMPRSIAAHGAIEIDGNFTIVGGYNNPNYLHNVWALNTTDKNAVWISEPFMSTPRSHFSIAKIDGKVFVCGGLGADDNVEIFDGEVWRNGPKMTTTRAAAATVVIPMEFAKYLK